MDFFRDGRINKCVTIVCQSGDKDDRPGILHATSTDRKESIMKQTIEVVSELIRNPKHLFRKTENQPQKARKHRYERRKIKEYLHLNDWFEQETA
jgi:hypothetical protein